MTKTKAENKTLLRDLAKLLKENEALKKQIEHVKASKSVYMLQIQTRTNHNERISYETKYYSIKADAKTDLEYEYYKVTGTKCDKHVDSITYEAEDGSIFLHLDIVKLNVL